jgi:uncharacterized protein YbcI
MRPSLADRRHPAAEMDDRVASVAVSWPQRPAPLCVRTSVARLAEVEATNVNATPQAAPAADGRGSILKDISNAMVGLFKEQFGRGPTKVRSDFANEDTLICVLENTFTPAEKNMVKLGEHQRLRDVRLFFQHASEKEFRSTVERIVGRPVRAYTSAIDTDADLCVEVFVFEREP